ncbi:hypothetical protein CERZMDRAFT_86645 [Cercospora zeae-maydis SCOH1-5]|uniref:SET domain-containing protein n=1 Tax=Cercospora zeae-maydis SCOH1-5 TaxID=717836 RepID=A0A6A6F6S9_9PEZI|nr:hypothetical protein CERZMDRAFT_86645 [Cercospora zeae-maydis SCOH1-5]
MDNPFDPAQWQPTRSYETWEKKYSEAEIRQLGAILICDTKEIISKPHDAKAWIKRGYTLHLLRYPELAVGDGFKAVKLCRDVVEVLQGNTKPNFRLGVNMGFWMRHEDEDEDGCGVVDDEVGWEGDEDNEQYSAVLREDFYAIDLDEEHDLQAAKFAALLAEAEKIVLDNLDYAPNREEGVYSPRPYPWMKEEHLARTDQTLLEIEQEFRDAHKNRSGTFDDLTCLPQRHAFGFGVGPNHGRDVIGVFAQRDLDQNELVLIDKSRLWGCAGPGAKESSLNANRGRSSNLYGGVGCIDELHPNDKDDAVEHDLRWIRDCTGAEAPHVILMARCLLACVQDKIPNPLDHTLIARLTPHYDTNLRKIFCLDKDISILNSTLARLGIDIFANHNFDTWVLFTLEARVANNAWSDPQVACLSPLFALINHSCDPNLSWRSLSDHRTLILEAKRAIKKGEQLSIEYDAFQHHKPLEERREKLRRWLSEDCVCTRCVREANAEAEASHVETSGGKVEVMPSWMDERPAELPEDGVEEGKWEGLWKEKKHRGGRGRGGKRRGRQDSLSPRIA